MNKIYENIKAIRQAKGLTQTYLAEKVGIAINNYGKLERGEIHLTIERLEQLAGIFGMTVIELLQYGSGVEKPQIVVDTEKVKELENKVKELESEIKYRQELFKNVALQSNRLSNFFEEAFIDVKIFIMICEEMTKNNIDYETYFHEVIKRQIQGTFEVAIEFSEKYEKLSEKRKKEIYHGIYQSNIWKTKLLCIEYLQQKLKYYNTLGTTTIY